MGEIIDFFAAKEEINNKRKKMPKQKQEEKINYNEYYTVEELFNNNDLSKLLNKDRYDEIPHRILIAYEQGKRVGSQLGNPRDYDEGYQTGYDEYEEEQPFEIFDIDDSQEHDYYDKLFYIKETDQGFDLAYNIGKIYAKDIEYKYSFNEGYSDGYNDAKEDLENKPDSFTR